MKNYSPNLIPQDRLEQALKHRLEPVPVSDHLLEIILNRLALEQTLANLSHVKMKLWSSAVVFLGALSGLAMVVNFSFQALSRNSTLQFLSLLVTDFGSVMANWQDYSFSILENLPVGWVILLLGLALASLLIGEYAVFQWQNFKKLTGAKVAH